MCQVHAGAYVSLPTPGETNYFSDCHPRKTTTYILLVVSITTHTHDRRKSIGEKKQRKGKKIKQRKEKRIKRNKTRKALWKVVSGSIIIGIKNKKMMKKYSSTSWSQGAGCRLRGVAASVLGSLVRPTSLFCGQNVRFLTVDKLGDITHTAFLS